MTFFYINTFAVSGKNIFVGTDGEGVFLSTNNGASWDSINSGLPDTLPNHAIEKNIYSFAICGAYIFVGNDNGVYLSTNNGLNWVAANNSLPNASAVSLAFSGTNLFASIYGYGVYISDDFGSNWESINNGLIDSTIVTSLVINKSNIIAGTNGTGIWIRPLAQVITGTNQIPIKGYESKLKISPNPVKDITNIKYQITNKSHILIIVYDITGREITTLVNEEKAIGNYNLNYNTSNLSSGVYFLKLSTADTTKVVKFVKE